MLRPRSLTIHNLKLRRHRRIFHIAIAPRLIQLVARQTRTSRRRIRLNGVAFIQQTLVVKLLQQPPKRLNIFVVIGDIRMIQIHKIAHALSQFAPFSREFHHVFPTPAVIIFRRNIFVRSLVVNILLRDTQLLLHTKLHRQTVCVPTGLALHLITLHRLITIKRVFNRARQHMVNARMTISRRRTFEEHKLRLPLTLCYRTQKNVILLPISQHILIGFHKI